MSVEKPFHVRSQIHPSSLNVNNKITHCVSSAQLLNTSPIKNLLSRVQESPDPITRVQVGVGVEEHVPSPSPVSLNRVFPCSYFPVESTLVILLFNETNNRVRIKPTVIYQREIYSCVFLFVQRWIFTDAVMLCTSRTLRRLVRNLKGGINSD